MTINIMARVEAAWGAESEEYAAVLALVSAASKVELFKNRFTANVQPDRECSQEEAEANARLIAAAPELLQIVELYALVVGNTGYAVSRESAAELYEKATAAIARATQPLTPTNED